MPAILIATVVLHGIALNRNSGNLASLGIASSNLWIGMHAVTSRFSVGPLDVLPIEGALLLFLLLMTVTAMNAYMATKFAKAVLFHTLRRAHSRAALLCQWGPQQYIDDLSQFFKRPHGRNEAQWVREVAEECANLASELQEQGQNISSKSAIVVPAITNYHIDAVIPQVLSLAPTLIAVSQNGYSLAFENAKIYVIISIYFCHVCPA